MTYILYEGVRYGTRWEWNVIRTFSSKARAMRYATQMNAAGKRIAMSDHKEAA